MENGYNKDNALRQAVNNATEANKVKLPSNFAFTTMRRIEAERCATAGRPCPPVQRWNYHVGISVCRCHHLQHKNHVSRRCSLCLRRADGHLSVILCRAQHDTPQAYERLNEAHVTKVLMSGFSYVAVPPL